MQATMTIYKAGGANVTFPFPGNWNELTPTELEIIAREQTTERDHPAENKAALLIQIIQERTRHLKKQMPFNWVKTLSKDDAATQGFDAIQFLYVENTRTVNPYPTLKISGEEFVGPEDDFDKLLCGEFEDTEVFFGLFQMESDSNHLAKIASILWRPAGEGYNKELIESRLALFQKLPPEKLLAIYIWYNGCRLKLRQLYPYVYSSNGTTPTENDLLAFTNCIHAGAGPKNGNRENIRSMRVKEFLYDMNLEAKHAHELQKKHEEQLRKMKR
ncbi:MAG TPA: hypothetical protein PKY29_04380 [Ferruginibacter sp.]|nr:hypothetical protein [Ferruginibacter sp.]HRQ20525.1 hypothetical protein [Ferruginibacter sp.]